MNLLLLVWLIKQKNKKGGVDVSFYCKVNSSAICSLIALDESLKSTTTVQWVNRPEVLVDLDKLRLICENQNDRSTEMRIADNINLSNLLTKLSDQKSLPRSIDLMVAGHKLKLNLEGNRYSSNRFEVHQSGFQSKLDNAMNELSIEYRKVLQNTKDEIFRQEQILDGLQDKLSSEELEARREQINAHRDALLKANNDELKKQEQQIRAFAEELNLELLKPIKLARKKKFVFIRRQ